MAGLAARAQGPCAGDARRRAGERRQAGREPGRAAPLPASGEAAPSRRMRPAPFCTAARVSPASCGRAGPPRRASDRPWYTAAYQFHRAGPSPAASAPCSDAAWAAERRPERGGGASGRHRGCGGWRSPLWRGGRRRWYNHESETGFHRRCMDQISLPIHHEKSCFSSYLSCTHEDKKDSTALRLDKVLLETCTFHFLKQWGCGTRILDRFDKVRFHTAAKHESFR